MSDNRAGNSPRVSRVRVTVLACILLVIGVIVGWNARTFFRLNHADYLLNQRQFDEGLDLLTKIDSGDGDNPRADLLRAKALTLIGDYDQAITVADHTSVDEKSENAEVFYWKAVAQFQSGQTTASQQSAKRFLASGEELPNGTGVIAGALAGESVLTDIPAADAAPFRMMFPVEQATYLALAATQQADLGHFDLAARVFERAFVLGNRNTKSLQNAALVCALIGDIHAARMYVDFAGADSLVHLCKELERRYGQTGQAKLTLQGDDVSPGRRRVDVARSVAWAESELLKDNPGRAEQSNEIFARLLQDYSNDPVVQLCQADAMLTQGRTSDALRLYKNLQVSDPTLATEVRIANLAGGGDRTDVISAVQPFLKGLGAVEEIRPGVAGERVSDAPLVQTVSANESDTVTLNISTRGTYLVSLIARSTKRTDKWPLLYLKSNGETVGLCYVSSESWGVYSAKVLLDAGQHRVELAFRPDDAVDSGGERGEIAWALALVMGSSAPE